MNPIEELITVGNQYYIHASSRLADDRTLVLKQGDTFAIFNRYGDIQPIGLGEQGIFHRGVRHLSRLELFINGKRPLLLHSTVQEDNDVLTADLTNPEVYEREHLSLASGVIHVRRSKLLWGGACYEKLDVTNYSAGPANVRLDLQFDGDFADIFEVRGAQRPAKGHRIPPSPNGSSATHLGYEGLDGLKRNLTISCNPEPKQIRDREINFELELTPRETKEVEIVWACRADDQEHLNLQFADALKTNENELSSFNHRICRIDTSSGQFNRWLNRSYADLYMMLTRMGNVLYPYAGIPWFSTVFGRDGIITAWQCLMIDPMIARGVLTHLSAHQAQADDPAHDAEPGKILHETRDGEMAALDEIPFRKYYGSVDSTPLYLILAAEYYRRTSDLGFIRTIRQNIDNAVTWMSKYGDRDGDGFIEFERRSSNGLTFQGWKDSHDSIFHADGRLATGPIALCEVQTYAQLAYAGAADIFEALGETTRAFELKDRAERLQQAIELTFWDEELNSYVLALDGDKRPCRVRTSNAGHCLLRAGIDPNRARRQVETLMNPAMFSGWGVRTVATNEFRFNPLSYHNGSVWPHDNALIALAFSRCGFPDELDAIINGLFDATLALPFRRLPELFCGFARRKGLSLTLYPVACSPQAWSCASVFMFLSACLNPFFEPHEGRVTFRRPHLPSFLDFIRLRNIRVNSSNADIIIHRSGGELRAVVERMEGNVEARITT